MFMYVREGVRVCMGYVYVYVGVIERMCVDICVNMWVSVCMYVVCVIWARE